MMGLGVEAMLLFHLRHGGMGAFCQRINGLGRVCLGAHILILLHSTRRLLSVRGGIRTRQGGVNGCNRRLRITLYTGSNFDRTDRP